MLARNFLSVAFLAGVVLALVGGTLVVQAVTPAGAPVVGDTDLPCPPTSRPTRTPNVGNTKQGARVAPQGRFCPTTPTPTPATPTPSPIIPPTQPPTFTPPVVPTPGCLGMVTARPTRTPRNTGTTPAITPTPTATPPPAVVCTPTPIPTTPVPPTDTPTPVPTDSPTPSPSPTPVNQPPNANNETCFLSSISQATCSSAAPGVLNNDNDPDLDPIVVCKVQGQTNNVGVTHLYGPSTSTIQINANGSYVWTNNGGFSGPAHGIGYTVCDSHGAEDGAILTIQLQD